MRNLSRKIGSDSQKGQRAKFLSFEQFMVKDQQQKERDNKIVDAYRQEFGEFQGFTSIKFDSRNSQGQKKEQKAAKKVNVHS